MENYKIIKNFEGIERAIKRLSDNACISMSEDNTDYQAYLKWLDEGNTPLPAEE